MRHLRALGRYAGGALAEGRAEEVSRGEGLQEAVKRLLLVRERGLKVEEFAAHAAYGAHGVVLLAVEHLVLDAGELGGAMVRMLAHGVVEVGEEYLEEHVRGKRLVFLEDGVRLEELLQAVEGGDDFVAHRHDEMRTDDEVDLLVLELALGLCVFGEVKDEEGSAGSAGDERGGGGGEEFKLDAAANAEFFRDGAYLLLRRLFEVDPDAALVLVAEHHYPDFTMRFMRDYGGPCDTLSLMMDTLRERTQSVAVRGITFALVAALSFGAGVAAGSGGTAAVIVAHIPFLGDGLDATPDQSADLTDFWKAWNALHSDYVITHASSTMPSAQDQIFGAISGLAASYGDPYTVFFPPEEAKAFNESISGSFGGVGMEIDTKNGALVVVSPLKGTPAAEAGILTGDEIVAIDGKTTDGLPVDEAVQKIRGPVGTVVDLTIVRAGKQMDIKVTRATIQVPETDDGLDAKTGVYHIALYEFTSNSANLFNEAFTRFKLSGSRKLVIDLRGNPGGYLDAAVDIASHFLPKGTTIVTEDFGGKQDNQVHTSLGYDDLPGGTKVAVLIDGGSASASEILAGALKDNHAATLIGAKSFGKGSVQELVSLDGGSLKITVARWITPSGNWIMGNGITPDIAVPYTQADAEAKQDPQMQRAVQFLTARK